jgi:Bacterial regulatory proteins, tetR family
MAGSDAKVKIIEAAFRLFHEAGYNGTSIQDIVNAAGFRRERSTTTSRARNSSLWRFWSSTAT